MLKEWWNAQVKLWKAKRRNKKLSDAITLANELTRADRKTRYVIDGQNRFKILSTDEIDAMKIRGFFKKGVTMLDIYKRSVYVATYNKMIKEDWQKVRYAQRKKLDGKY